MERKEVIRVLMTYGHSAAKAVEITIDHERGDDFARKWVDIVADLVKTREEFGIR